MSQMFMKALLGQSATVFFLAGSDNLEVQLYREKEESECLNIQIKTQTCQEEVKNTKL